MVELGPNRLVNLFAKVIAGGVETASAGVLIAKAMIANNGAVGVHVVPGCGANPDCVNLVVETVKALPMVFPVALLGIGAVVTGINLVRERGNVTRIEASLE